MTDAPRFRPIEIPNMAAPIGIADQAAPLLQWVELADLVIDDTYQRPLTKGGMMVIAKIAANFNWACFSPVILAPVAGGKFAVIDGQHRVHAALWCGMKSVPAMIVLIDPTKQAAAFIAVNTARTNMSNYNLYRAGLASGEDWAIRSRDAVAAGGCKLMVFNPATKNRKPGEICAVGLVRTLVMAGHAEAVTTTLTALRAVDPNNNTSVLFYSDWLLNPLMRAVADFPGLSPDALTACLRKRRPTAVMGAADRLAKAEGKALSATARAMFLGAIRAHLTEAA